MFFNIRILSLYIKNNVLSCYVTRSFASRQMVDRFTINASDKQTLFVLQRKLEEQADESHVHAAEK